MGEKREMKPNGTAVVKNRTWSGAATAIFFPQSAPSRGLLRRSVLYVPLLLFSLYASYLLFLFPRSRPLSPPLLHTVSTPPPKQKPLIPPPSPPPLALHHIVFGIASSSRLWSKRKDYIKLWFSASKMHAHIWLDKPTRIPPLEASSLPQIHISADTSKFPYTHKRGRRAAIRISRIISETLSLSNFPPEARWLVMCDDDTILFTENLIRVLSKYDHRQDYYIGSVSESHLQNIKFSYSMAYGGGGFAVSRPLAEKLSAIQDRCISRYPALYGSDDRIHACMSELGVPLTREVGFHQFDVYGSLLGLLAAHPVAPLVSLHHLDVVDPVIPGKTRVEGLKMFMELPGKMDQAGIMQQSICYVGDLQWTVIVAWGYAVEIIRGVMFPREAEIPARTFLNWYKREDYRGYPFNTRALARNPCQKPFVFFLSGGETRKNGTREMTVTRYERESGEQLHPVCNWKMEDPSLVNRVVVFKKADPHLWNRVSPSFPSVFHIS